jgi:sugar phosphate isomerase/epimerase
MTQFAFSTNAFKRTSLEEAVTSIASCGYSGVEIMADIPHAYPPHMPTERVAALLTQLRQLRLQISNINAFTLFALGDTYRPTWIDPDPAARRQRISHTAACIEMAAKLGASTISLQPGGPLTGQSADNALDLYADGIMQLLAEARRRNITLTVEPEPGLLIETSVQCREFISRINDPNLRMNADIGHFFCVGEDPAAVIESCHDIIAHIHVEDIAANRVHQHLIPGTGAIDFDAVFSMIRKVGYQGWVTVELYPYETTAEDAALQAMKYLQRYM